MYFDVQTLLNNNIFFSLKLVLNIYLKRKEVLKGRRIVFIKEKNNNPL